ncbi:gp58 [Bacillus phage W.Ph.]|uniref:Gp58 n=1 Tax=Bacillus phage W.Ph. TaxID=764595 RepID=G9B1F9_9CAUD|nr:gp58 [Bacillus phage W.Ph.]ADH03204.1 gp58 [Bacillus phage W.Ph.]
MQNRITDYIDGMIEAKLNNDGSRMLELQKQYTNMNVSVTDVGDAILYSLEGVMQHVDSVQAMQEARLRIYFLSMPEDVRKRLLDFFEDYEPEFYQILKRIEEETY